jgi:hypothetical protein
MSSNFKGILVSVATLIATILVLLFVNSLIAVLLNKWWIGPLFFPELFLVIFVYVLFAKLRRQRTLKSSIDDNLRRALETMDSTARWYNDENEANRELVTCLKAQGIYDVSYQYELGNGRTVDAKVGDILIEGKLSPDTEGVDRLIGQLRDYAQYGKRINIVIYGQLNREARRRIESEIYSLYIDKVFLTYLNNPKRQRKVFL